MNILESVNKNFLENKRIEIHFLKSLNKKEKDFLLFLFKEYYIFSHIEKKSFLENLPLERIIKILKYEKLPQLEKFLNNLLSKKISFKIYDKKTVVVSACFPVISSYSITYSKISLMFPHEIRASQRENTIFSLLKIDLLIFMRNEFSYNLYIYLISSGVLENKVEVVLSELKNILKTEEKYERFFDFETKILKKAVNDINLFSDIELLYDKIKVGENKNNRVEKISFTLKRKNSLCEAKNTVNSENINEIMDIIIDDVKNFHSTFELIKSFILKRGFDYVKKNTLFTKKTFKDNIETNLKKSLLLDLANSMRKVEVLIASIYKKYSTPFLVHLEISRIFKKNNLNMEFQELLDSDFFYKLNFLKDDEVLEKRFDTFNVYVHFFTRQNTTIKIHTIGNN